MNGVLAVDKTEGPTSHDVVAVARRALDTRRIGHTGTLDPFATGLLILCVGPATKVARYLTGLDKSYEATARLGIRTDTLDPTGTVVEETRAWEELDAAAIRAAFEDQQGAVQQRPPSYSAKRVGGKKSYELARAGKAVELAPADVEILGLDVVEIDGPDVRFRIRCSTGTYVRAVARDAGAALGVGAHLAALRRTAIGPYDAADAVPFDVLKRVALANAPRGGRPGGGSDGGGSDGRAPDAAPDAAAGLDITDEAVAAARAAVDAAFLTPLDALAHLPRLELDAAQLGRVRHGQSIEVEGAPEGVVVLVESGELRAVAESNGRWVRPRKVFT